MARAGRSVKQEDGRRDHAMIPLYILEILKERGTNEERRLIYKEIETLLGDDYHIFMERKAVSRYVNYLIETGYAGKVPGKQGCYYLPEDQLEEDELRLLLYSVAGNSALARTEAEKLMAALASQAPELPRVALAITPGGGKREE